MTALGLFRLGQREANAYKLSVRSSFQEKEEKERWNIYSQVCIDPFCAGSSGGDERGVKHHREEVGENQCELVPTKGHLLAHATGSREVGWMFKLNCDLLQIHMLKP